MPYLIENTDQRKLKFLKWLARGRSPSEAARKVKVSCRKVYEWREEDPQFAQAWGDAIEQFHDSLEDVARERAVDGVLSKVIEDNNGKVVGEIRRYNDRLLELLLKRRRPEIYDPTRRILNVNRKSG